MSVYRTLYLVIYAGQAGQRAHFGIWVPDIEGEDLGTLIHVVGSPMAGFALQFKRNYSPKYTKRTVSIVAIGHINAQYVQSSDAFRGSDTSPITNLEHVASQIQPPQPSENFRAPVNDTTNRRCQEWTMDFVRRLVAVHYIDESAIGIVQSRRDPPNVGIGLRPVAPQPQQISIPQQVQQQVQQQTTATASGWKFDTEHKRYRRWDGAKWVWQE